MIFYCLFKHIHSLMIKTSIFSFFGIFFNVSPPFYHLRSQWLMFYDIDLSVFIRSSFLLPFLFFCYFRSKFTFVDQCWWWSRLVVVVIVVMVVSFRFPYRNPYASPFLCISRIYFVLCVKDLPFSTRISFHTFPRNWPPLGVCPMRMCGGQFAEY